MIQNEIWREVRGFKGNYRVSNLGNVISKAKVSLPFRTKAVNLDGLTSSQKNSPTEQPITFALILCLFFFFH